MQPSLESEPLAAADQRKCFCKSSKRSKQLSQPGTSKQLYSWPDLFKWAFLVITEFDADAFVNFPASFKTEYFSHYLTSAASFFAFCISSNL